VEHCVESSKTGFPLNSPWSGSGVSSRVRAQCSCCASLCHCADPDCAGHTKTVSPEEETALVMPYWVLGWDVFCWLGHRRFARHWSVPQIPRNFRTGDAIERYVGRHQLMLAARQDPRGLAGTGGPQGLVLTTACSRRRGMRRCTSCVIASGAVNATLAS
jgi:hypothetical protein